MTMECVAPVAAELGEGPVWSVRDQALYWVDILTARLWRWQDETSYEQLDVSGPVCSLMPCTSGGFIGGGRDGFILIDDHWQVTTFWQPELDRPDNRMNDGKIDRAGRLWAGSMDGTHSAATGALYRVDHDLSGTRIDDGYGVTNGPAFSADGAIMYHTDSARQTIYAFDLDQDGHPGERKIFAQFGDGDGYPDGMTVDVEGCLWVAFWDGWCLRRLSPDGRVVHEVPVPVQRPTSCAFGGPQLDQLFITSARQDLTTSDLESQPNAGGLFRCMPGVPGIAELPFAG